LEKKEECQFKAAKDDEFFDDTPFDTADIPDIATAVTDTHQLKKPDSVKTSQSPFNSESRSGQAPKTAQNRTVIAEKSH